MSYLHLYFLWLDQFSSPILCKS